VNRDPVLYRSSGMKSRPALPHTQAEVVGEKGAAMGAEHERAAGFGRLEDGLRQAGDWCRRGPYLIERL
jgi:hypothetical protein